MNESAPVKAGALFVWVIGMSFRGSSGAAVFVDAALRLDR
jgi:hypothetical protein